MVITKKSKKKKFSVRKIVKVVVAVSFFIQLIFIIYFFFKVTAHIPEGNTARIKLIISLVVFAAILFAYFKWLRKNKMINKIVNTSFSFILYLHAATLFYIVVLKWLNPPITITQLTNVFNGNGLKRDYVSFRNISYNAKLAVIASEDQLYPDHNGFDWNAIKKSINPSKKKRNKKRKIPPGAGASTISQQVAKNVFLWQGKSYLRKGMEAYFTFMIEKVWGKKRILDVYLNCIEMGKGVFGVEAAAQSYFNKPANQLTRQEAAMITACFPNPKIYTVKPVSSFVAYKSSWVMNQMANIEDDEDIQIIIKN